MTRLPRAAWISDMKGKGLMQASEHAGALIDFPGFTVMCPGAFDNRLSLLISSRLTHFMWVSLYIAA